MYLSEFKSVQGLATEEGVQVFQSVSESSSIIASSVKTEKSQYEETIKQSNSEEITKAGIEENSSHAPKILLRLHDMTVKCGEVAQFICAVQDGNLQVTWKHEGQAIEDTARVKISQNGNVMLLTIENVQLTDQGTYSCTLHNDFGEETSAAVLTVEGGY